MNDYELQRQKNISHNHKILKDLGLNLLNTSNEVDLKNPTLKKSKKPTKKKTYKTKIEILPQRTSHRLKGIEPPTVNIIVYYRRRKKLIKTKIK
jgi:hypothetical protein